MSTRVVLITGCSNGGIGAQLCKDFAAKGCLVYATARRMSAMDGIDSPNIKKKVLDVTDEQAVNQVTEEVVAEAGQIDIVVSNAGYLEVSPIIDMPMDRVAAMFDANTFGTLRLARSTIPHMAKRREGLFMVVGSVSGLIATPWNGMYSASKAALNSITDSLRMECQPLGVKVMLVAPGGVKSELSNNNATRFSLPENSLYKNYTKSIMNRMYTSQNPRTVMTTATFSQKVVNKALQKSPPGYYSIGGGSLIYKVLLWLPKSLSLWIFWKIFGKANN